MDLGRMRPASPSDNDGPASGQGTSDAGMDLKNEPDKVFECQEVVAAACVQR